MNFIAWQVNKIKNLSVISKKKIGTIELSNHGVQNLIIARDTCFRSTGESMDISASTEDVPPPPPSPTTTQPLFLFK